METIKLFQQLIKIALLCVLGYYLPDIWDWLISVKNWFFIQPKNDQKVICIAAFMFGYFISGIFYIELMDSESISNKFLIKHIDPLIIRAKHFLNRKNN